MTERTPFVFVIDDDLSVRRASKRLLTAEGYVVETFESAEHYLESGKAGLPDCLIV